MYEANHFLKMFPRG